MYCVRILHRFSSLCTFIFIFPLGCPFPSPPTSPSPLQLRVSVFFRSLSRSTGVTFARIFYLFIFSRDLSLSLSPLLFSSHFSWILNSSARRIFYILIDPSITITIQVLFIFFFYLFFVVLIGVVVIFAHTFFFFFFHFIEKTLC